MEVELDITQPVRFFINYYGEAVCYVNTHVDDELQATPKIQTELNKLKEKFSEYEIELKRVALKYDVSSETLGANIMDTANSADLNHACEEAIG